MRKTGFPPDAVCMNEGDARAAASPSTVCFHVRPNNKTARTLLLKYCKFTVFYREHFKRLGSKAVVVGG